MDPLSAKTLAAATGATVTALTMTPFDVVKTRLQTQPTPNFGPLRSISSNKCCQPFPTNCIRNMSSLVRPIPQEVVCLWDHGVMKSQRVTGFWDAVVKVCRTEGVRGLWKGSGTSLLMAVPSATMYMVAYDHLLRNAIPSISPAEFLTPLISGVISRSIVSSLASPLELLRTNLQSTPVSPSQPHTFRSVLLDMRSLVRSQGLRSLWRGLGPTLWRDVPFSGIYWANYELWKASMERHGYQGPSVAFISGAFSGTTAAILTSPFDVLKTRRQALLLSNSVSLSRTPASSSIPLLISIVRREGVDALFTGLSPRIAKIAPACGIMIACFEGVGSFLAAKRPT